MKVHGTFSLRWKEEASLFLMICHFSGNLCLTSFFLIAVSMSRKMLSKKDIERQVLLKTYCSISVDDGNVSSVV